MMVAVTCQYTNVTFEADSRRQKNHPRVSAFLNSCANNKRNPSAYNMALAAFRKAKEAGLTEIDAIMAFAEQHVTEDAAAKLQQRNERQAAQAAADKAFEEKRQRIKAERKAQNEFLHQHGYTWRKEFADFDEYEEGEPSLWVLRSTDGREVTPAQALDEIARGVEVVLAEIAAKEAEAEAKRQASAQADQEDHQRRQEAIAQVRSLGYRCDPFDRKQLPMIYELRDISAATHLVFVHLGEIDGIPRGAIYEYWGGHDYSEFGEYWSTQP